MRIEQFTVTNQRSIRHAACESVPRVMIVTGPNGSGKSTLLQALRRQPGSGPILYVGPHRTSRRQQVRMRHLHQQKIEMRDLLASTNLPGFEGITIPSTNRNAWDFDEANSFLKYGLCQIELDRQTAITERFDEAGEIKKDDLPDIWKPLREMTENLLPHLHFFKIDVTNRDGVLCLWNVHSKDIKVDIDDLSSGEKSIIQLFFPLIEHRIQSRLEIIRGVAPTKIKENVCVLMDEPELHLHPNLQGKVLDYIRAISLRENPQFILATHSPTIVEQATSEELFLLRPTELIAGDLNQLVKIATDDEKLELMRDLFGTTSNITAMRPILVVEGRQADETSRRPADARIYGFLNEQFSQLSIIPAGGKSECKKLTKSLTETLAEFSPKLKAYALLDRDLEQDSSTDTNIILLPVSMIENLLIDPNVIWNAITAIRHRTTFGSDSDIEHALNMILDEMETTEVNRRVKASVGTKHFRLRDPIDKAKEQIELFIESLQGELSDETLTKLIDESKQQIEEFKKSSRRREYYDGKAILNEFFGRHLHNTGMSKEIFIYDCAREASKRRSVSEFVQQLFDKIGIKKPEGDNEEIAEVVAFSE